jgi:hypothetical protein
VTNNSTASASNWETGREKTKIINTEKKGKEEVAGERVPCRLKKGPKGGNNL